MSRTPSLRRGLALLGLASLFAAPVRAQFTVDNSRIPATGSSTENVDFGDVDLDGDWDVAVADGGDDGNDQNRLWINDGGAQNGTVGFYSDETSMQLPNFQDDSRDIEFVDFDNDGDLDIYDSNTAQLSNQGNRWWANMGGTQGGTIGFYADQTSSRWVGLGGRGSSIDPSDLIAGTFIDWSCDCDFGDLDNDGDMDLVHSSYGGSFAGAVPTRIFLNDGAGFFSEFNPTGFQLSGVTISNGDPGIWCDGTQQSNTTVTDGSRCDISATALDIDVGDIDGDFDLDILHGARNEAPRMFANRLDESGLAPAVGGGQLGFRDVTGMVFPSGYTQGTFGHYEQEMGDMDGDGDLDIYGLNWLFTGFSFDDITLTNNGDGTFSNVVVLPGSSDDDNEGDFLDYDNDGDLDLYVANFSGQDKLYRNDGGPASYTLRSLPSFSSISLDADAADADNDGDYDVLVAEDSGADETFLLNTTQDPDVTAPSIPRVEQIGPVVPAQIAPRPVRAQVYDNAPYYITWYNDTDLLVRVNGVMLPAIDTLSSGGQIFRGELPGNLVGKIEYAFRSADKYANTGMSETLTYRSLYGKLTQRDPVASPAPAGPVVGTTTTEDFTRAFGTATAGAGGTPALEALSAPYPGTTLYLHGSGGSSQVPYALLVFDAALARPLSVGNLVVLNAFGESLFLAEGRTDAGGDAVVALEVPDTLAPGTKLYAQFLTADGLEQRWAASQGVEITIP